MKTGHVETSVHIDNTPSEVMNYIADVRNRPLFLGPLKSIDDIQGEPSAKGTRWKWTWVALGMEFEGTGECLEHDAGSRYAFRTTGGITSTWTYEAQPERDGVKLRIAVDFEVPERDRSFAGRSNCRTDESRGGGTGRGESAGHPESFVTACRVTGWEKGVGKRGQVPKVRSTRRAVPAFGT